MGDVWTVRALREFLTVLYGGQLHADGWHPDTAVVARRRRVSRRTVQRWISGDPAAPAPIPPSRLRQLQRGYRLRRSTLQREEAARTDLLRKESRRRLGRGRGNLREYEASGWLEPHLLLLLEAKDRPLRRIAVTRDTPSTRQRASSGFVVVDEVVCPDKFIADAARLELLYLIQPWRLEMTQARLPKGRTQVWLSAAPVPSLGKVLDIVQVRAEASWLG